jgi:hypothetical protein
MSERGALAGLPACMQCGKLILAITRAINVNRPMHLFGGQTSAFPIQFLRLFNTGSKRVNKQQ